MLSEYSVSSNEDGTFTLDFEVNKNVKVDFVYNDDKEIHEVHLEAGKTSKTTYSTTLTKEERKVLRIDFVNHINAQSKSASKEGELTVRRKPRVAVDNGESGENQTTAG